MGSWTRLQTIAILSLLASVASGQQCSRTVPCGNNLCCSQWGYCGSDAAWCGQGCQNGPCWSPPGAPKAPSPPPPKAPPAPKSSPSPGSPSASKPPPPLTGSCCAGKPDGSYNQDPKNCAQYCICQGGKAAYTLPCPSGLYFNDVSKTCDWPANVKCGASPTSSPPPPPGQKSSPPPPPPPGQSKSPPPPPGPLPPASQGKIVAYWGQNGNEGSLLTACQSGNYDILVLSFLVVFGMGQTPQLNLAGHCDPTSNGCVGLSSDINACQGLGRKVILSLGGAAGSYGFFGDSDAQGVAQYVWNNFLGGSSGARPLGAAALDGVDLDIEGGSSVGYAAFVTKMRSLMDSAGGKKYYITGAPQCPFPDAYLGPSSGTALRDSAGAFDYVWVQFYNNFCGNNPGGQSALSQSWNQWSGWLATANRKAKLVLGVPASQSAAGSGYIDPSTMRTFLSSIKTSSNYGGVMMWDVFHDISNGPYSAAIRSAV